MKPELDELLALTYITISSEDGSIEHYPLPILHLGDRSVIHCDHFDENIHEFRQFITNNYEKIDKVTVEMFSTTGDVRIFNTINSFHKWVSKLD